MKDQVGTASARTYSFLPWEIPHSCHRTTKQPLGEALENVDDSARAGKNLRPVIRDTMSYRLIKDVAGLKISDVEKAQRKS